MHSNKTLFLVAINYESTPEFFLLKFLENDSKVTTSFSIDHFKGFTGLQSLVNTNNEPIFSRSIANGNVDGYAIFNERLASEFAPKEGNVKLRYAVDDCIVITTSYYTDWYREYSDGSRQYIGSTYEGTVDETFCSSSGGPSTPPSGGGGGGTYTETTNRNVEDIDIDRSVLDNPKVKCTLTKLFIPESQSIFNNTIQNFAGSDSDFDLVIELVEVDDDDAGSLVGGSASSLFRLQIDKSRAQQRVPIQIAVTILHEAIHAEMRRYLAGATDVSTLPGFPGSFAEDWNAYINAQKGRDFEEQLSNAEHTAMASAYISVIADGLQDFDNNSLPYDHYEALAWEGLIYTQAYANLNISQRNRLGTNYQAAIAQASQSCN